MPQLVIERIAPGDGRVSALLRIVDEGFMRTSAAPGLPERALALLPGLARHRCESGHARGIVSELADTESAHLLEHVAIELMALAGEPRTTSGRTEWDFARDGRGVFRVRIGSDNAAVAAEALRRAAVVCEWLLTGAGTAPDIASVADGVRAAGVAAD